MNFNLFKILLVALLTLIISLMIGCKTDLHEDEVVEVVTFDQWEGHYYSAEEAMLKLKDTQLSKGKSIWMMSNTTLKRLLQTQKEKTLHERQ